MKSEPLVSAIIIFLNQERFLQEAIDSVFAQSLTNWELLLVDDGSTDGSTEIARRCAEQFPDQVRYLEHEGHKNRGMSAARNLGLRHAHGEFISWLDSDDVWLPKKLQRQVELISAHPEAAMVYGPLQVWFSWTGKPIDFRRDYTQDIGVPPDTLLQPPHLLIHFLKSDTYIPGGELVRRTVLDAVGGYEEWIEDDFEDQIVYFKICLKWPVFASGECWYKYRQHENSFCAQAARAEGARSRRFKYFKLLVERLRAEGCDHEELWQVLQNRLNSDRPTKRNTVLGLTKRVTQGSFRLAKKVAKMTMPQSLCAGIAVQLYGREYRPPVGYVHFGGLRRVTPISKKFGITRGLPCDQYYIEQFLEAHASDIQGRVLETGDRHYTIKFGGDCVTKSDVLNARPGSPQATMVGDLCIGESVPQNAFDCVLFIHVLPFLWDFKAAIANATRALKPGGVMLATLPGIAQISRYDNGNWGDFWRFTSLSTKRLFEEHFDPEHLKIDVYGNVLTAVAFLHGLAADELHPSELNYRDPAYEVLIAARALKPE